jgi:hypothetical protein
MKVDAFQPSEAWYETVKLKEHAYACEGFEIRKARGGIGKCQARTAALFGSRDE